MLRHSHPSLAPTLQHNRDIEWFNREELPSVNPLNPNALSVADNDYPLPAGTLVSHYNKGRLAAKARTTNSITRLRSNEKYCWVMVVEIENYKMNGLWEARKIWDLAMVGMIPFMSDYDRTQLGWMKDNYVVISPE